MRRAVPATYMTNNQRWSDFSSTSASSLTHSLRASAGEPAGFDFFGSQEREFAQHSPSIHQQSVVPHSHIFIYRENADALNEHSAQSEKFVIHFAMSERANSHCAFAADSLLSAHTAEVHGQELNKLNMTRITSLARSSRALDGCTFKFRRRSDIGSGQKIISLNCTCANSSLININWLLQTLSRWIRSTRRSLICCGIIFICIVQAHIDRKGCADWRVMMEAAHRKLCANGAPSASGSDFAVTWAFGVFTDLVIYLKCIVFISKQRKANTSRNSFGKHT